MTPHLSLVGDTDTHSRRVPPVAPPNDHEYNGLAEWIERIAVLDRIRDDLYHAIERRDLPAACRAGRQVISVGQLCRTTAQRYEQ